MFCEDRHANKIEDFFCTSANSLDNPAVFAVKTVSMMKYNNQRNGNRAVCAVKTLT